MLGLGHKKKGASAQGASVQVISIGELDIHLSRKRVKNINLRVGRDGKVMVSAPTRVPLSYINDFVRSKSGWIHQCQKEAIDRLNNTPRQSIFEHNGHHYFWGQRHVIEHRKATKLAFKLENDTFKLSLPDPKPSDTQIQKCIDNWYRAEIKNAIPALLEKWQPIIGVEARDWGVKKMRTKWGTCNIQDARIWLNLELCKYPKNCLEYVVVHELAHLHERHHNRRFYSIVEQCLPDWKAQEHTLENFVIAP